ncbi:ABC transporter permease [Pleionea sediminis]|uniref:ABC transporter permease n=1 Tax=Pleionea sediminis TaxID=2569479 RepID=UPI00197BF95C|nr:ABC transporter permease [Pleionea sediminis]
MISQINSMRQSVSLSNILWLETRNEILKTFRMPAFVIPSLIFPVMFYVFFGVLFNQSGADGNMSHYLIATYGVFGIMGPALFSFGVGVAVEKDQGWFAVKRCSPMPISAYFISRILTSMIFGLIIVLELFIIGAVFGDVVLTRSQWILTLVSLLLGTLPFCVLGLWIGLTIKGQAAPAIVNLIYLPMAFLSGLWIPLGVFPEFMQNVAWIFPAFHLSQMVLSIQGLSLGFDLIWHLLSLVTMSAIAWLLAARAFNKHA